MQRNVKILRSKFAIPFKDVSRNCVYSNLTTALQMYLYTHSTRSELTNVKYKCSVQCTYVWIYENRVKKGNQVLFLIAYLFYLFPLFAFAMTADCNSYLA